MACAFFSKPGKENQQRNWAVFCGALIPDVVIFIMFGWSKLIAAPEHEVWSKWYYDSAWTLWIDAANSIPLFLTTLGLGLIVFYGLKIRNALSIILIAASCAALLHLAFDLPVHVDDGHAHFWPFTHWRYISTISYWDSNHYGHIVSIIELIAGLFLCAILWRRFSATWIRSLLVLCMISYLIVPLYFFIQFG
jgi:hypothetical protein